MIKVSAPGKIHLSGEHSVVYGQPALLTAIDRRCFVSLKKRDDQLIEIKDKKFKKKEKLTFNQIRHFAYLTKKAWQSNDPLALVKIGINEIYSFLEKKPICGFDLAINSQIPFGSGLGSSAALAVGLVTGVLLYEHSSRGLINEIAFQIEKRQHGCPSGGDNTVVTFGGFLRFQKKANRFEFDHLKLPQCKDPVFTLVDSGQPMESTGEMVAVVRQQITNHKSQITKIFKKIGEITNSFIKCFQKADFSQLKYLINENERLLEELGVVGNRAKKLIQLIKENGGAAKICGAGGVKQGSGMILVYHHQLEELIEVLKNKNIKFMKIKLGEEGVRYD